MANYRLARSAREDLSSILAYTASDGIDAAVALNERFEEILGVLARNPAAGRERPELGADVRSFPIGSWVIIYGPAAEEILIARILRAAIDLTDELEGLN